MSYGDGGFWFTQPTGYGFTPSAYGALEEGRSGAHYESLLWHPGPVSTSKEKEADYAAVLNQKAGMERALDKAKEDLADAWCQSSTCTRGVAIWRNEEEAQEERALTLEIIASLEEGIRRAELNLEVIEDRIIYSQSMQDADIEEEKEHAEQYKKEQEEIARREAAALALEEEETAQKAERNKTVMLIGGGFVAVYAISKFVGRR